MTVNAHFVGKVIVPDEPLDLPANQALILQIQPVSGKSEQAEESVLSWLAATARSIARLCLRIWRIATTITFAVVPRSSEGSGHLLRGHYLLDRSVQQTGSVPLPSSRMARGSNAGWEQDRNDRGILCEWLNVMASDMSRQLSSRRFPPFNFVNLHT